MEIRPIGGETSGYRYTDHRTVAAKVESEATEYSDNEPEETSGSNLSPGDRVVIRHLDVPRSRPEFYVLSEQENDPLNGFLSLSSPLGRALSEVSPGDEFTYQSDGRDRPVLFVNLEREARQVA